MEAMPSDPSVQLSPLVRRLLAPNPSAFTFTGTQTHIVGHGAVAVIDPGPDLPAHIDAIVAATAGERIAAIVCTHTHRDHSPGARLLREATGAPIVGCAPLPPPEADGVADEAYDADYRPDRVLEEGEALDDGGWRLVAVATPGHTSNHLCFALPDERALFSGDHVMGWSTSIVSPPDGDMGAYMASLEKLQGRDECIYYPAHGEAVTEPARLVRGLLLHRRQREAQVLGQLRAGETRLEAMVAAMYKEVDIRLHSAAARSVLAHLLDLERRGLAERDGEAWRSA
jgi:glyoxylase-like metal-dependent hydrolase (beta-lactamase superfamily II)